MYCNRRTTSRRGVSVLETALVAPVLLLLVFGGIEWGLYLYARHVVQDAALAGARVAILPGHSTSDVTAAVSAAIDRAGFDMGDVQVLTFVDGTQAAPQSADPGEMIKVTVELDGSAVGIDLWGSITGDKTVSGAATMRREG